jgi:glycosyltransferase involved in cell wall biosynthesis
MISICIPVYNSDVRELVDDLYKQSMIVKSCIEIVLIDDASSKEYRDKNKGYCNSKAKYIELSENIGRAKIRNLFLEHTNQPYLVFLDCDVVLPDSKFVERYIELIHKNSPKLGAGGHYYTNERPSEEFLLRWKFGVKRESPSAIERQRESFKSFKTSNFLVSRELFQEIHFDENIEGYGHEDTLFGFEIKKRQIKIHHIENPVLIKDIDSNEQFIAKTKRSIENLVRILAKVNYDRSFITDVTLLRVYFFSQTKTFVVDGSVIRFTVLKPCVATTY